MIKFSWSSTHSLSVLCTFISVFVRFGMEAHSELFELYLNYLWCVLLHVLLNTRLKGYVRYYSSADISVGIYFCLHVTALLLKFLLLLHVLALLMTFRLFFVIIWITLLVANESLLCRIPIQMTPSITRLQKFWGIILVSLNKVCEDQWPVVMLVAPISLDAFRLQRSGNIKVGNYPWKVKSSVVCTYVPLDSVKVSQVCNLPCKICWYWVFVMALLGTGSWLIVVYTLEHALHNGDDCCWAHRRSSFLLL
jgi:hypothetical protein